MQKNEDRFHKNDEFMHLSLIRHAKQSLFDFILKVFYQNLLPFFTMFYETKILQTKIRL